MQVGDGVMEFTPIPTDSRALIADRCGGAAAGAVLTTWHTGQRCTAV